MSKHPRPNRLARKEDHSMWDTLAYAAYWLLFVLAIFVIAVGITSALT